MTKQNYQNILKFAGDYAGRRVRLNTSVATNTLEILPEGVTGTILKINRDDCITIASLPETVSIITLSISYLYLDILAQ